MIGHNTSGTVTHRVNAAVARLGLALQDGRTIRRNDRAQMIIIARCVVAVDAATAGNEALSDAQIRAAGITLPTDLIANSREVSHARWMARGGLSFRETEEKNDSEINDLTADALNRIEARFLTGKRFAKLTTYGAIWSVIARECKTEIRKALEGAEGDATIEEVKSAYSDILFKDDTVTGWITEETEKRSDKYQQIQDIKKACAMAVDKLQHDEKYLTKLAEVFKDELDQIRKLAAQQRAEKEAAAVAKAANLTLKQRRLIASDLQRSQEGDESPNEISDDDF